MAHWSHDHLSAWHLDHMTTSLHGTLVTWLRLCMTFQLHLCITFHPHGCLFTWLPSTWLSLHCCDSSPLNPQCYTSAPLPNDIATATAWLPDHMTVSLSHFPVTFTDESGLRQKNAEIRKLLYRRRIQRKCGFSPHRIGTAREARENTGRHVSNISVIILSPLGNYFLFGFYVLEPSTVIKEQDSN